MPILNMKLLARSIFLALKRRRLELCLASMFLVLSYVYVEVKYWHLVFQQSPYPEDVPSLDLHFIYDEVMRDHHTSAFYRMNLANEPKIEMRLSPSVTGGLCQKNDRTLQLYVILSDCKSSRMRNYHRDRLRDRENIRYLFLLAECREEAFNKGLSQESQKYSDIMQFRGAIPESLEITKKLVIAFNLTLVKECRNTFRWFTVIEENFYVDYNGILNKLKRVHSSNYEIYSASYIHWNEYSSESGYVQEYRPYPSEFLIVSWPLAERLAIGLFYHHGYLERPWINIGMIMSRLNLVINHWAEIYPRTADWNDYWLRTPEGYSGSILATNSVFSCIFYYNCE